MKCFVAFTEHRWGIGFSAYATAHVTYAVNDLIEFDGVNTNLGGHYDNDTSFTCPVNGTYFFTVSVMTSASYHLAVAIEIDSVRYASAYNDGISSVFNHATNSALLRCNEGQKVFVRCVVGGRSYGTATEKYSTFSGFLVAEI